MSVVPVVPQARWRKPDILVRRRDKKGAPNRISGLADGGGVSGVPVDEHLERCRSPPTTLDRSGGLAPFGPPSR